MEDLDTIWREYQPTNVGPGSTVLDIGCSDGYFSEWAGSMGAYCVGYDARNGLAVGPHDGVCEVRGDGFGAYIVPDQGSTRMVGLSTLLNLWDQVDFLKCDIEGGEYLIFNCDLSNVARFGIEFHVWTTPDNPQPGLGLRDEPMPAGQPDRLIEFLERTHDVTIVGNPAAGGYLIGARR